MSNNTHENDAHFSAMHEKPLVDEAEPESSTTEPASQADERTGEKPRWGLTRRKKVVAAVIALLVVIVAAYFIRNAFLYEDTDDAQVDGHVMPLSARISGHILQVNVVQGQLVHTGDVLVIIDPKDYEVAADQAKANLADAEASAASSHWGVPITSASAWSSLDSTRTAVQNAEAGVNAAERNLDSAKAVLSQAEANAAKTDADLVRYSQLVAKEDVSRQQYDQAVAAAKANRASVISASAAAQANEQALRQAEGKLLQAKADLRNAETAPQQVSVARSKADAASAQVLQRQAQLEQAELNLGYTVLRSPVTGIIGKRNVEVGQNVSIGQELVDVVPLDDVWVNANFKETQLAHMRPGQLVEIKVDAYGRKWKGRVTNLGGGTGSVFSLLPPENATGNYVKIVQRVPVRIDFEHSSGQQFNADGLLKPGLSVEPDVRVR
jgi:membrane fusion protein (multidrug efflux system)